MVHNKTNYCSRLFFPSDCALASTRGISVAREIYEYDLRLDYNEKGFLYLSAALFVCFHLKAILRSRHESRDEIEGFMVHD